MTSSLFRLVLFLLLPGLLTGCSWLLRSGPEKQYYMLQAQRSQETRQQKQDSALLVRPFSISQAFEGQELILQIEQDRFVADYKRRFLIPAQDMITELTRNWLAESGLFSHVLPQGAKGVQADYHLQARIHSLYLDQSGQQPATVLEMEFLLLGRQDRKLQILGQENIRKESELQRLSASEAIQAWSRDLALTLQELESCLQEWLPHENMALDTD
ncbi:MAG: ABC-type transport auxiliary lipoprotein family protein [Desulfohalobiaceae bacterium]